MSDTESPEAATGVTGRVAMLEVLPARPDPTVVNRYGGVSIIPASERGHADYVRAAVKTGIKIDHVDNLGWTALLAAIVVGDGGPPHRDIVRTPIAAGADVNLADGKGVSPLRHALDKGRAEVAEILPDTGARAPERTGSPRSAVEPPADTDPANG
jgi:ankyrin repeat protein